MRRLVLIRHAHAERSTGDDRARRLTPRGEAEAIALGRWLAAAGLGPGRILVSPARRAAETWRLAAEAGATGDAVASDQLYEADRDGLFALLAAQGDGDAALALVGHNPAMHELAAALVAWPDRAALVDGFPPATAAALSFAGAARWAEVAPGGGRLDRLFVPPGKGVGGG
jgi:phosphohistidine phosphatase